MGNLKVIATVEDTLAKQFIMLRYMCHHGLLVRLARERSGYSDCRLVRPRGRIFILADGDSRCLAAADTAEAVRHQLMGTCRALHHD